MYQYVLPVPHCGFVFHCLWRLRFGLTVAQAMERTRRDCGLGSLSCDSRVAASDRMAFCSALSGGRVARELAPVLRGLRMRIVPPIAVVQLQQAQDGRSEDGQHRSESIFVLRESGLLLATPDAQVV